ncbi:MAG TPA: hypothetical protein VFZ53_14465 [Polyangiaceae bacterium]
MSAAIGPILSGVGAATSGAAKGAESERMTQADYALGRDRLGLDAADQYERALQNRADIDLRQREAERESRQSNWENSMRSALALNFQPAARPQGVSNISFIGGGIGDQGRAAAEEMQRQAMLGLLEGESFDELPALAPYNLSSAETLPKAGTLEKIMGILGLGATAAGGVLRDRERNAALQGLRR